jgi:hypothetical protein
MKIFFLIFVLTLIMLSCKSRSSQQPSAKAQDSNSQMSLSTFTPIVPFDIDSIPGYSIFHEEDCIEITKNSYSALSAIVYSIDSAYLPRAKELDSVDIIRGFALAHALSGPGYGDPDNCETDYTIDSLFEFTNRFNLRCFRIILKGTMTCADSTSSSSYYQCYIVSVSEGEKRMLVQIPKDYDFLDNKTVTELSKLLANSIKCKR